MNKYFMCSNTLLSNSTIFTLKIQNHFYNMGNTNRGLKKICSIAMQFTKLMNVQQLRNMSSFTYQTKPYKYYNLEDCPPDKITVTKEDAVKYYFQMALIRRLEVVANALYKEKAIRGFCHLYNGQEACAVGIKAAMREQDSIISAYRIHGIAYLMGITPLGILAELTGRETGCARGKGGSMHMYSKNFYGGNGIIGAQIPLGAGIALANQYTGNNGVCIAMYGDGAANQGQVFEAYNMAYLWKIPCIFVCENNIYGMGTSSKRHSSSTEYHTRGHYIPGLWIDGMDVLTVRAGFEFAIKHALERGPIVIELNTYRYVGHSMSDPGTSYRSREEVQEVREKRDPITTFRTRITKEQNIVTEDQLKEIDNNIKKDMDEAAKKCKEDKEIPADELYKDVYFNNLEPKVRGTNQWIPASPSTRTFNREIEEKKVEKKVEKKEAKK